MKTKITLSCLIGILMLMTTQTLAQIGINTDNSRADPSAGLDVKFNNKGVLFPRLTFEQLHAIQDPAEGLMVYCTNCNHDGTGVISIFQGGLWKIVKHNCYSPHSPAPGTQIPAATQIIWNWDSVQFAFGYKWNTTNDYATAMDMGTSLTKTETGLICNTNYTRYVWSYSCGPSTPDSLIQTTMCSPCGTSITVSHVAGAVSPVTKTVTYGTVTNIPGEPAKCWITSNLGADHQATAVDDATEASAGWYWQFNRKQGYKHDGTTRTPNTTWIHLICETSDWIAANDPCALELEAGAGWRLPTYSEWNNVNSGWTNWNGPWNSTLKMHAAGLLYFHNGSLDDIGNGGHYWSSTQGQLCYSWGLYFYSDNAGMEYYNYGDKAGGFALRCIKDN